MKFTLTFDGDLPSAANRNKRVREKWDIRRQIHDQLNTLWCKSQVLRAVLVNSITNPDDAAIAIRHNDDPEVAPIWHDFPWQDTGIVNLCSPILVNGYRCLPLVRKSLHLTCELDILFLRQQEPGELIHQGGDLDNRIKTLFDGLKMPGIDDFIKGEEYPPQLCCLLEDDSLISGVSIRTDRLLSKPDAKPTEVRLVIRVSIKVLRLISANASLLSA
jgi:hypothetical protein